MKLPSNCINRIFYLIQWFLFRMMNYLVWLQQKNNPCLFVDILFLAVWVCYGMNGWLVDGHRKKNPVFDCMNYFSIIETINYLINVFCIVLPHIFPCSYLQCWIVLTHSKLPLTWYMPLKSECPNQQNIRPHVFGIFENFFCKNCF